MRENDEVLTELRAMAATGCGVADMCKWLLKKMGLQPSSGRIQVISLLQQAFFLSVGDAAAAGAWDEFPGGTWSDAQVDEFLLPRIRSTEERWRPAR